VPLARHKNYKTDEGEAWFAVARAHLENVMSGRPVRQGRGVSIGPGQALSGLVLLHLHVNRVAEAGSRLSAWNLLRASEGDKKRCSRSRARSVHNAG
jgi:hypothetical protein